MQHAANDALVEGHSEEASAISSDRVILTEAPGDDFGEMLERAVQKENTLEKWSTGLLIAGGVVGAIAGGTWMVMKSGLSASVLVMTTPFAAVGGGLGGTLLAMGPGHLLNERAKEAKKVADACQRTHELLTKRVLTDLDVELNQTEDGVVVGDHFLERA